MSAKLSECLLVDERAKQTAIQLLARNNHLDLTSLTLIKLCFSRVLGTLGAYSGEPLDLTRRFEICPSYRCADRLYKIGQALLSLSTMKILLVDPSTSTAMRTTRLSSPQLHEGAG